MAKYYCPECRADCGVEACPTDEKGLCKRCGKHPVAWEDRNRPWLWCTEHKAWHDKPCAEEPVRHCCAVPKAA